MVTFTDEGMKKQLRPCTVSKTTAVPLQHQTDTVAIFERDDPQHLVLIGRTHRGRSTTGSAVELCVFYSSLLTIVTKTNKVGTCKRTVPALRIKQYFKAKGVKTIIFMIINSFGRSLKKSRDCLVKENFMYWPEYQTKEGGEVSFLYCSLSAQGQHALVSLSGELSWCPSLVVND